MIPNFTDRARRYVRQSPQLKKFQSNYSQKRLQQLDLRNKQERLIKGIARLLSWTYREGFAQGIAHPKGCDCVECKRPGKMARRRFEKFKIKNRKS